MVNYRETRDDSSRRIEKSRPRPPGLVAIMIGGEPASVPLEVGPAGIDIGRGTPTGFLEDDDCVSRKHARVRRTASGWQVRDHESRNGTFVFGRQLAGEGEFQGELLIRVGRSLLWAVDDIEPFREARPSAAATGPVLGGRTQRAWREVALASRSGSTLYVRGESGSGKELAARAFHDARFGSSSSKAPFVAVNCAAIPEGLAERLLFGVQRGAYSGAVADAEGYLQAAHKGTLFLDEIAELDPLVQAKLLRVLETREVLPLGSTKPRSVEIGLCVASHRSLRDEVARNRFREDLYFRLGRPEVQLPALRERLDELPVLAARELREVNADLTPSVAFIEACALRLWPGNVRELLHEVRRAAYRALDGEATLVEPHHLAAEAGLAIATGGAGSDTKVPSARVSTPSDEEIERALEENGGNVRGTARSLGVHRNQLRRWLERKGKPDTSE